MPTPSEVSDITALLAGKWKRNPKETFRRLCIYWSSLAQNPGWLVGATARTIDTVEARRLLDDPAFATALETAFGRIAPKQKGDATDLANQARILMVGLHASSTTPTAVHMVDLARASAVVGSIQGQICTLHALLDEGGRWTPLMKRGLGGALAATVIAAPLVWETPIDQGVSNVTSSLEQLQDVAVGALEQGADLLSKRLFYAMSNSAFGQANAQNVNWGRQPLQSGLGL